MNRPFSMRKEYAWRSILVAAWLLLFALAIVGQIIRIQRSPEADIFRQQAGKYAMVKRIVYPERGKIYDRTFNLLAGNEMVYTIGANMPEVTDKEALAREVAAYLGLRYEDVYERLRNPYGLIFVPLANFVPAEIAQRLRERYEQSWRETEPGRRSPLAGLEFQPALQRSYPENDLASNVLGFLNREGMGIFGVEEKYHSLLAGMPVEIWVPEDPNRAMDIPHVPDGASLVLTIDRDLQLAAEEILDRALEEYGARNGVIIVMDPRNGEVLAMATTPRLNLNRFWEYDQYYQQAYQFNPAISMQYEPGSVFKILVMAAALDSGLVTPQTTFYDTGMIVVGQAVIQNWNRRPWGQQTMQGCLQYSLNVCLAWLATSMGEQTFYGYLQRFGIGRPTGIDLAGEAAGRLKLPGDQDWYPVDLGTNSFGQGVAVTPIQMMMAASAIANQGRMVRPHILRSIISEGQPVDITVEPAGTPIRPETARMLNEMLVASLENEASLALVPGYRVAGKTGTAQIPMNGHYSPTDTNVSFVGWGPADDPQFMIYVWLERPTVSIWAGETAAPVFSEMAQKTVVLLDIPPDAVRLQVLKR